jgi:acetyl esterase/lipase
LAPLLIQVGENEILYDDVVRICDHGLAAGVDVTFESRQHAMHVWPVYIDAGLPESAQAIVLQGDEGIPAKALTLRECYLLGDAFKEIADNHQL